MLKLNRSDKKIKIAITGYSFDDSEILLEITPLKEIQIIIEPVSPIKARKVLSFCEQNLDNEPDLNELIVRQMSGSSDFSPSALN